MNTLVDNDVLVKGACYGVLRELVVSVTDPSSRCGLLGAARFVVPKAIARQKLQRDLGVAQQAFQAFLDQHDILEPTTAEQEFAAELESAAQALALNLDTGESQLAAILVKRAVPHLLTGDKRAIVAMEQLLETVASLQPLVGTIHCLEQAIRSLIASVGLDVVRKAICAEPHIDKTLSICFSCASGRGNPSSIVAGLESYIADLRSRAPRMLAA